MQLTITRATTSQRLLPVLSAVSFVAVMLMGCTLSNVAAASGKMVTYFDFDPPPAKITPLSPDILRQDEADPVLAAARAAAKAWDGKTAFTQYQKAIAAGNVVAMVELGDLQDETNELNIPVDFRVAGGLYERAALLGYAKAQRRMAIQYQRGRGLIKDMSRALAWHEFAAAQGDDFSAATLSVTYFDGRDVPMDSIRALHYAERGAEANGPMSALMLSLFYLKGRMVERDATKAFALTKHAAELGDTIAELRLAEHYLYGVGVSQDLDRASHWLSVAKQAPAANQDYVDLPLADAPLDGKPGE